MVHTAHITSDYLRELDVFRGLPSATLQRLLRVGNVRHMLPRECLASGLGGVGQRYYFLLRGVVAIALDRDAMHPPQHRQFLGYFEAGACFSDAFLDEKNEIRLPKLECVAANAVSLLELGEAHLRELLASEPLWRNQLADRVASARELFLTRQDATRRVVLDFFLRENFVTSSVVRVGRLDRCLDCNKCRNACAKRHGQARMARSGPRLGQLTFPIVCRNCHDQPCIAACSFGGFAFDEASGDMRISDRCAGCGACAQQCPNDAISMVWRPYTVADFPDPIPLSDATGMTNVGNLLVAGDISGAALIRLAMNEAVRAVDRIEPSNCRKMALSSRWPSSVAARQGWLRRCVAVNANYPIVSLSGIRSAPRFATTRRTNT